MLYFKYKQNIAAINVKGDTMKLNFVCLLLTLSLMTLNLFSRYIYNKINIYAE